MITPQKMVNVIHTLGRGKKIKEEAWGGIVKCVRNQTV